jgi:hypothetical protein
MNLVRLLSGIITEPVTLYYENPTGGKDSTRTIAAGTSVVVVGLIDDKDGTYYVCLTGDGETLVLAVGKVKITIDKDLRERLAEATLSDSGGGGR